MQKRRCIISTVRGELAVAEFAVAVLEIRVETVDEAGEEAKDFTVDDVAERMRGCRTRLFQNSMAKEVMWSEGWRRRSNINGSNCCISGRIESFPLCTNKSFPMDSKN